VAELMEWIQPAEDSVHWWALVNLLSYKPSCSIIRDNILTTYPAVNV
jgi:hypothetical protein